MMTFSDLNINRLYLKVADKIIHLVVAQGLNINDKLPSERLLSSEFGVSRPTVREALVALELAGIVEIKTASGIFIKKLPVANLRFLLDKGPGPFEILDARRIVESETCALAAPKITSEDLLELSRLLTTMEKENLQESPTEEADHAFHLLIANASGNSALSTIVHWLWELRNNSEISTHFHQQVRLNGIRPIINDHKAILNALKNRDQQEARASMNNHLQRVIDGLMCLPGQVDIDEGGVK